jgi:exodeoxyribonuclease VII small subunit
MAKKETKGGFEANLKRLEQIVAELEKGEIDLERSLKLYEEGAGLIAACRKQLMEAQTRIENTLVKYGIPWVVESQISEINRKRINAARLADLLGFGELPTTRKIEGFSLAI